MRGSVRMMLGAVIAAVGLAGGVNGAWAQAGMETAQMVSGKISAIDPLQRIVRVKTGLFATKTFVIQPDTKISNGQNSLNLEQLHRGDRAVVEYMQQNGKQVAQTITVESGGIAPAAQPAIEPQAASPSPEFHEIPASPPSAEAGTAY